MKFNNENVPSFQKPEVAIIQKDTGTKKGRFPAHGEKVTELNPNQDPSLLKKSEYDDLLISAREKILNNQDFLEKIVRAIITFKSTGSVRGLAEIENILTEICLNLKDTDIESVIKQLDNKVLGYILSRQGGIDVTGQILSDLTTGKWRLTVKNESGLGSKGIMSSVNFIRARTKFLKSHPEQKFVIGFNNKLDATTSIDFIEIIFDGKNVGELNLIQVKTSPPNEEDIADIQRKHRDFANNEIMKIKEIEDLRIPEEKEMEMFEATLQNQAIMFERLFEICIDYRNVSQDKLITMLGLGNLSNMQRAWILDTHFDEIKSQIESAYSEGYVEEKNKDILIKDLDSLRQTMTSKAGIPKDIIKIYSVNSIIAVGPKEFKKVNIYNVDKSPLTASVTM